MSVLALSHGAARTGGARRSQVHSWPRLPLKRIIQFTLIALVIVPIPSDDGPVHPSVTQPRTATVKTVSLVSSIHVSPPGVQR